VRRLSFKAAAIGLGLFGLGVAAGLAGPPAWRSLEPDVSPESSPEAMRVAFARTAALTTSQTLLAMPRDAVSVKARTAAALAGAGLSLDADALILPGRPLLKAELHHLDGGPAAQFVWLDEQSGAISLFVMRAVGQAAAPAAERRADMNLVWWERADTMFALVGLAPEEVLQQLAQALEPRLARKG
jgi:hypothetical protein